MKASDIAQTIEDYAPLDSGTPGDELGFIYGDGDVELTGLSVCWSPTLEVVRRTGELGHNMIVSHEPLFFQSRWSVDAEAGDTWFEERPDAEKTVNRNRVTALDAICTCVYRAHSNWDPAPEIGIVDALATDLELGPALKRGKYSTVHEIEPIAVRDLAKRVKYILGTGPLRVVGDLERTVTRVGTLVGGLGQMFNSPEEMDLMGAEAVVAGECLAYTFWSAIEHDVAIIEAGHCSSENPGMQAMAKWLAEKYPDLKVQFLDSGEPWHVIGTDSCL